MSILSRVRWWTSVTLFLALVVCFALSSAVFAVGPGDPPLQISSDPYTNSTSQHQTEVEPDSYSSGSTIVAAIQVGCFTDGGAYRIGPLPHGVLFTIHLRIKDMSQQALAEHIAATVGWIGRVERGIHLPNLKLLFKIAKALQVRAKDLFPNEL